jgi:hypothetical protein
MLVDTCKSLGAAFLRSAASSALVLGTCCIPADAQLERPASGYDDSWYLSEFWTGEYPSGFAVIKKNVVVAGRSKLDKIAPRDAQCELPYLAAIHPWNKNRRKKNNIQFWSATKIVPLIAKVDFVFEEGLDTKIPIKKGDTIEYVRATGEGFFKVRIAGKLHDAEESLFERTEDVPQEKFHEDEWVVLNCVGGRRAYLLYPEDLADPARPGQFVSGVTDYREGDGGYGKRRDLTEAEARTERAKQ